MYTYIQPAGPFVRDFFLSSSMLCCFCDVTLHGKARQGKAREAVSSISKKGLVPSRASFLDGLFVSVVNVRERESEREGGS